MPVHLIDVPFLHRAEVLRRRKRNPESLVYLSSVTVAIEEVSAEEAPVAVRIAGKHGDVDVRARDGGLLVRVGASSGPDADPLRADTTPVGIDWLRREAAVHRGRTNHFGGAGWPEGTTGLKRLDGDRDVRAVLQDGAPAAAAATVAAAAAFVLVDGELWVTVPEPTLRATPSRGGVDVRVVFRGNVTENDYAVTEAAAIAEVGLLGAVEGHVPVIDVPRFEVLRPDLLRRPVAERACLPTCDALTDGLRSTAAWPPDLRLMNVGNLRAARDAFARDLDRGAVADVDGFVTALADARDALVGAGWEGAARASRKVDQVRLRFALRDSVPEEVLDLTF